MIKAIFEEGDIPEFVTDEMMQSVAVRAERMYQFAQKNYIHGLPSGAMLNNARGRQEAANTLAQIHGQSALIEYCHVGPANSLHIGWMTLINSHGYDPVTNKLGVLSAQKGKDVYLHDLVVVIPQAVANTLEPGMLYQWGAAANAGYTPERTHASPELAKLTRPTPVEISNSLGTDKFRIEFVWEDTEKGIVDHVEYTKKVIKHDAILVDVPDYSPMLDFYHVKYTLGTSTVPRYWLYQVGTFQYPALDAVFNVQHAAGSFFPFCYFRYNKTSETANKNTESYRDNKKLLKYLGIKLDMVSDAINENPDINDVEQAMLIMAVPATSTNEIEQRYLFEFFDNMYAASDNAFQTIQQAEIQSLFNGGGDVYRNALVIQDKRFKMVLTNGGISKRRMSGTIGEVGEHTTATGTQELKEKITRQTNEGETVEDVFTHTIPLHHYRKQVAIGLYDEITVVNLKMAYQVFAEWYSTGDDENKDILLIPIDRSITTEYLMHERETLYSRSLHYVFNSRTVTKLKWYQTGLFKAIMIIVAIIITIVSVGSDGGATLGAALGLSGTAAIVATVIINLVIGKLVSVAFTALAKAIGAKWALVLAVIAAVAAGYNYIGAESLAGAPWATELLQIASGLAQGAMGAIQDAMQDLVGEFDALKDYYKEQNKLLEEANNLLKNDNFLSPFIIFGEKPNDFYNRTIHSGNIGIVAIESIGSYVDMALMLPKLSDTIEGMENG